MRRSLRKFLKDVKRFAINIHGIGHVGQSGGSFDVDGLSSEVGDVFKEMSLNGFLIH